MLNVGGAHYDEKVKRGWWLERWGGRDLEEMETVVLPAENEEGNAPADKDWPVANGDGPSAVLG